MSLWRDKREKGRRDKGGLLFSVTRPPRAGMLTITRVQRIVRLASHAEWTPIQSEKLPEVDTFFFAKRTFQKWALKRK